MNDVNRTPEGLAWQIGVWNTISGIYLSQIDQRFKSVVDATIARAGLAASESVLDLGTGTGAVAAEAAGAVGPTGQVIALDISPEMLAIAGQRFAGQGLAHAGVREGSAEAIPVEDNAFDCVLASLSMMYVIDRAAAAREIARVLRPGGRFIASVWAGAEECDIVLFQQTAGRFAGTPPVAGVGPAALADATEFLAALEAAGIQTRVEREELGFDFEDFVSAWDALAGVTTAHLSVDKQHEAKQEVLAAMYPDGDGPRHFRNVTQFIVGQRR